MKSTRVSSIFGLFTLIVLILAACTGTPAVGPAAAVPNSPIPQAEVQTSRVEKDSTGSVSNSSFDFWVEEVPQTDEQGAVAIEIVPVKLNAPGRTLVFNVRMNTHSVDLSMDLAELATLSTDTGKTVQAIGWDAPSGGHHVSGKLSFPTDVDGSPLLAGASKLTLTLTNVDAPERVFVWEK
jgi:hypothetical protein